MKLRPLITLGPKDLLKEVYYRYEDHLESPGTDELGDRLPGYALVRIQLYEFPVLKHTPKGVWIGWSDGEKKFVNRSWTKQYALPTIKEAQESFRRRKLRQIRIYKTRVVLAERALQQMDKMPDKEAHNFALEFL